MNKVVLYYHDVLHDMQILSLNVANHVVHVHWEAKQVCPYDMHNRKIILNIQRYLQIMQGCGVNCQNSIIIQQNREETRWVL